MNYFKTTEQPTLQDFHIDGVRHIDPIDAFEAITSGHAVMIDVREMNEVQLACMPLDRVLNHPMSVMMDRLSYIAKDQQIIVGCPGGVRSVKVAHLLQIQGYPNVASLDGGLTMWKAKGLPWDSNPSFGGCDCGAETQTNTGNRTSLLAPLKNVSGVDYKNLKRS